MTESSARRLFRQRARTAMKNADAAFKGQYSQEIKELLSLSKEQIDSITPDTTDLQVYDQLISIVKEASRTNVEQAELITRIRQLGGVAVSIAKKAGLGL